MRHHRFVMIMIFSIVLLSVGILQAQLELPRLSTKASVSQTVGVTDIEITYSRPGVKGRVIWGGLVPYDKIWRTGANEATAISFSEDVQINGSTLAKGKYALFTIPGKDEWTVIFNNNPDQDGAFNYDEKEDALRIQVKPQEAPFLERMMFYFDNLADSSADVVLRWEKLRLPFTVQVQVDSLVFAQARKQINWGTPYRAANFALQNEANLDEGLKWLEISIAVDENYWNTSLAARYFEHEGQHQEAIAAMEKALGMAKTMKQAPFNLEQMQKLLDDWKKR